MRAWGLLVLAIVTEIIGTLTMKWSSLNQSQLGYVVMLGMIACSYFFEFRHQAHCAGCGLRALGGIGILLITLFSVQLFDETLSLMKICGLITLMTGILLIKVGSGEVKEAEHDPA
ncbi:SMR family transporter [Pantoea ananatis]